MPYICRIGYLLTLLIGAALLTAMVWKPASPPRFAGLRAGDVPRSVGGYASAADDPIPAQTQAALASATMTSRTYEPTEENSASLGDKFSFTLIGGTDRSALHDPRSCLIGAGMQVENDHLEQLPQTHIQARVCQAISSEAAQTNAGGFDIIYFYFVNGHIVNEATQIRVAMLRSALLGRRGTPVYFLRFTRPLHSDPRRDAQGHAAMLRFATDMWTRLQPRLLSSTGFDKGYRRVKQNYCCQYTIS